MCLAHLCHVYLVQIVVKTVAAHVCVTFIPHVCNVCMEELWRAGGDDTAMCCKYIHRLRSQEGGLWQSNLTSHIMSFCTCVKLLERKHPILIEAFILLAMVFSSPRYQGPHFSWHNRTRMCWSRRDVLGCWITKKCAHHQWLDSSPGLYSCLWTLCNLCNWKAFLQVSGHFASILFSSLVTDPLHFTCCHILFQPASWQCSFCSSNDLASASNFQL